MCASRRGVPQGDVRGARGAECDFLIEGPSLGSQLLLRSKGRIFL